MKFKNFKLSLFIPHLIIGLIYPLIRYYTSSGDRFLVFIDSMTIISFVVIIFGVFTSLYLHGDFDITRYILNRKVNKSNVSFEKFMADEKSKEKDSFNYPLFTGLFLLVTSFILAELFF